MKSKAILLVAALWAIWQFSVGQNSSTMYKVIKTIPIAEGTSGWDYLAGDWETQRLFVSHGTRVEVIDLKTEKLIGQIPETQGVHGIVIVPALNKGFITAGRIDSVIVFDLATLNVLDKIATGKGPDFILYDAYSNRIFAFNGVGRSVTAIDVRTNRISGTLPLSGKPEAAVSNGIGKIFCNIEDKSTVVRIDALSLGIDAEWPLDPGQEPTGLALDQKTNRLFSACSGSNNVVILDAANGKIVATLPIGEGCDGIIFIKGDRNAVASNGDGTLTVIHQDGPNEYKIIQTLETRKGARNLAFDETTGRVYLPAADVEVYNGKRRVAPGTFRLYVVAK